jgi:hypothetical protein
LASVESEPSRESSHLAHAEGVTEELIDRSASLDLIVVASVSGAHAGDDLEPFVLEVIERARCPVLIVPAG